jgi:hypothetical protein
MELEFGPPTRDMGASEIAFQWDKIAIDGDLNIRPWRRYPTQRRSTNFPQLMTRGQPHEQHPCCPAANSSSVETA